MEVKNVMKTAYNFEKYSIKNKREDSAQLIYCSAKLTDPQFKSTAIENIYLKNTRFVGFLDILLNSFR